ncbi:Type 1 phosphatases regulator ypi1 [Ascochyta clinopodiicola]|nr:Type 1 phosphatases regulator ypi1 [Ascochyta clinopodiicola]
MPNEPPRAATASRPTGSQTIEATRTPASSGVLRLRAAPDERRHIQWATDVVDNEGMGKKSSKVCCIYHAPREAGESSDESSDSSSSSDEDSEVDNSTARPSRKKAPRGHEHGDGDGCEHDHSKGEGGKKSRKQKRAPSPNAYEKIPKVKK